VDQSVLLLSLDDYFSSPSQDCLARLFDAINSINLSNAPILTYPEKLVMRNSERKDVFIEKLTSHERPHRLQLPSQWIAALRLRRSPSAAAPSG
jgi:hypothetical protein